jgi:hypothetical protein
MKAKGIIIRGSVVVLVCAILVGVAVVEPRILILYAGIVIVVGFFFWLTNKFSREL